MAHARLTRFAALLAGGMVWVSPLQPAEIPPAPPLPLAGRTIVIDPGHAVRDLRGRVVNPGARAPRGGALERDIVLDIASRLVPLLEAQGARVVLTRTPLNPWRISDQSRRDNRARAVLANILHADAYIRLHCDWNRSRKFKGFTTYYFRWGSRPLAHHLHRSLSRVLVQHRNHGIHRNSFVSASARMPTVLLELGVLSNPREGKWLATEEARALLAGAIAEGILRYFQDLPKQPRLKPLF